MNKQGAVKEIVMPAIVLTAIALVVTALLAFTNALTAPVIEQNQQGGATAARKELIPKADKFTVIDVTDEYAAKYGCVDIYDASNGEGTVITVTEKGYNGDFSIMVGFNPDGAVVSYKALTQDETAGLGANGFVSPFADQFAGKKAGGLTVVKGAAGADNEISAMTGATITSKAITLAINNAGEVFKAVKGVQ